MFFVLYSLSARAHPTSFTQNPPEFQIQRVNQFDLFRASFEPLQPASAPTFIARLFGQIPNPINNERRFNLPFLCTLNPSSSRKLQTADCIADLRTLAEQGVTGITGFGRPPNNFFTLSISGKCSADEVVFVGTDVDLSNMGMVPAPGVPVTNQQNVFFSTSKL